MAPRNMFEIQIFIGVFRHVSPGACFLSSDDSAMSRERLISINASCRLGANEMLVSSQQMKLRFCVRSSTPSMKTPSRSRIRSFASDTDSAESNRGTERRKTISSAFPSRPRRTRVVFFLLHFSGVPPQQGLCVGSPQRFPLLRGLLLLALGNPARLLTLLGGRQPRVPLPFPLDVGELRIDFARGKVRFGG